jgi:YVTN family beta-propeller protein
MSVCGGVPMSLVCKGRFAALLFCFLICVGCGDVYRPTIIPNPVPTPDPKNFHSVFTVNQNGAFNPGTGMQVDVSGDSSAGVTHVAMMPVHATLQGTRVWVANQQSDSVSVFTSAIGAGVPIGTSVNINLPTGSAPVFVQSTESGTMYVANSGNATVSAISSASNVITSTIPVGDHPIAMAETPDGKKLYVVNSGSTSNSVTVVNTVDQSIGETLAVGVSPRWVVVRSDGARVYVLSHDDGMLTTINSLLPVDVVMGNTPVGAGADFLYYDSRRNRLYIPNPTTGKVGIYDASMDPPTPLATIDLTAPIPGGGGSPCPNTGCLPVSVAAVPDGTRAYVASYSIDSTSANCQQTPCLQAQVTVIDELSNQVTKAISLPEVSVSSVGNCASARFRISAAAAVDGSRVYVSSCDGSGVSSINTSGDVYFASIPTPGGSFSPTLMNISGATQSGSDTTYTYTYDPNSGTPVFLGLVVTITGIADPSVTGANPDNGTFTVTALGNGTFTVSNPSGVATTTPQNATGLGEPPRQNPVFMLTGS